MPTRKTNQLEIGLEKISDMYVRDALGNLLTFVNELVGQGLSTAGFVSGQELNLSEGGAFRTKLFTGVLTPSGTTGETDRKLLTVPGKIYGAVGHAQYQATNEWRVMARGSTTDTCYFSNSSDCEDDRILVRNSDATNANYYRVILFYTDKDV